MQRLIFTHPPKPDILSFSQMKSEVRSIIFMVDKYLLPLSDYGMRSCYTQLVDYKLWVSTIRDGYEPGPELEPTRIPEPKHGDVRRLQLKSTSHDKVYLNLDLAVSWDKQ